MLVSEKGFTSLKVLVFLLIFSILLISLTSFYHLFIQPIGELQEYTQGQKVLAQVVQKFKDLKKTDSTPEGDSRFDPEWQLEGAVIDGWTVHIFDASSKLNLNWINTDLIQNTDLIKCLQPGVTLQDVKQHRQDIGFTYDLQAGYKEFIKPEYLDQWFTPYGAANINTSYEYCLVDLYRHLTGDKGDYLRFHNEITVHLQQKTLWTKQDLDATIGLEKTAISGLITTDPSMNVNFVPKEILEAVVMYPFPQGKIENGRAIVDELLNLRAAREITKDDLKKLIPITNDQQQRIFGYLGHRTILFGLKLIDSNIELRLNIYFTDEGLQ